MKYKIRELREKRRYSVTELSKLSGVSRPIVLGLENENSDPNPTIKSLEKIAGVLGVSVRSLFLP